MPNMGTKRLAVPAKRKPAAPPRASLADALFTGTQQRVLTLLFGQPERSYYATKIIGLAKAGSGAVQRELARLSESGLATAQAVGKSTTGPTRHRPCSPS